MATAMTTGASGCLTPQQRLVDCELMNQLNVIIGFARLLVESDRLDAQQRRYASHIAASGAQTYAILRAFFDEQRSGSHPGIAVADVSSPGPNLHNNTHIYLL